MRRQAITLFELVICDDKRDGRKLPSQLLSMYHTPWLARSLNMPVFCSLSLSTKSAMEAWFFLWTFTVLCRGTFF